MNIKVLLIAPILLFLGSCSKDQKIYEAPEWAEGVVWYQIFPERFRNGDPDNDPNRERARGPENWQISSWTADWYSRADWESEEDFYRTVFNRRYGGDLQGVIAKLDYLKKLGVGGIYLNPVFDAQSLHKYDASFYHHIDRNFGPNPQGDQELFSREDAANPETWQWSAADSLFLKLITEAHSRDIKVIIDGVWNHTGTEFWAFQDVIQNQEKSPYKNWYNVKDFDDPATADSNEFDYEGWWGFKSLPVFKEEDGNLVAPVKNHIFAVTKRWMDPNGDGNPSDGIDGWRLDVAEEVGKNFWKEWHKLVKKTNPDAITVAEIWTEKAKEFIHADMFTSVMNYRFAYATKDFLIDGVIDADEFIDRLNQINADYPAGSKHVLQNLMDSHDTPRLASIIVNPGLEYDRNGNPRDGFDVRKPNSEERQIQKLVSLFQFTWPGSPMIYYGTEAGMWGADDPDNRKPMLWDDLNYDDEQSHPLKEKRAADTNTFDQELFNFYASLAQIRNNNDALQFGETEILLSDSTSQVVVYKRSFAGEHVFVALNRGDKLQQVNIPLTNKSGLMNIFSEEKITSVNGIVSIEIKPVSGVILK